jgi:hypothetical protein
VRHERALTIDFVDDAAGPGARVAVELSHESAERLVEAIQALLAREED